MADFLRTTVFDDIWNGFKKLLSTSDGEWLPPDRVRQSGRVQARWPPLGSTASERTLSAAVVIIAVRRTTTFDGGAGEARIGFYRLTLSHLPTGRWVVVRAQRW